MGGGDLGVSLVDSRDWGVCWASSTELVHQRRGLVFLEMDEIPFSFAALG